MPCPGYKYLWSYSTAGKLPCSTPKLYRLIILDFFLLLFFIFFSFSFFLFFFINFSFDEAITIQCFILRLHLSSSSILSFLGGDWWYKTVYDVYEAGCLLYRQGGIIKTIAVYNDSGKIDGLSQGAVWKWKNPRYHIFMDGNSGARIEESDMKNVKVSKSELS